MPIRDIAARNMFSALSRILALSDQLHMTLSLMGEDVREMEKASADPVTVLWNQQVEECLDEWLNNAALHSGKVH